MAIPAPEALLHRPDDGAPTIDRSATSGGKPAKLSFELFKVAYDRLTRHAGNSLSGGLAFGALLSIAPLAIVVIAITSAFLGEGAARQETLAVVQGALGEESAPIVAEWIDQARNWSTGATIVGAIMFFLGAARLVGLIDESFEIVFEVPPRNEETALQSIRRWASTQAVQVAVTFVAGLLMAASLFARTLSGAVLHAIDVPAVGVLAWLGQEAVALAVWTAALAVIYRVLPPVRLSKADVVRGAVVSAVLLEAVLLILRALAAQLELGAAYGAAGAIVATLLTLYFAGQTFLFGAEVTAELAERRDGPAHERLTPLRAACTVVPQRGAASSSSIPTRARRAP